MLAGGGVCRVRDSGVRVLRVVAIVVLVRELKPRSHVLVAGVVEGSEDLDVGLLAIVLVRKEPSDGHRRYEFHVSYTRDLAQTHPWHTPETFDAIAVVLNVP